MLTALSLLPGLLVPQQETERVSVNSAGVEGAASSEAAAISADGQMVAFQSAAENLSSLDANGKRDVLLRDFQTQQTELISQTTLGAGLNGDSMTPAISGDGLRVVYATAASNADVQDINQTWDVVLRDRATGTTRILSRNSLGLVGNAYSWTPCISADGQWVAFESGASNLVPSDLNEWPDVFVVELASGQLERISVSSSGEEGNGLSRLPSLSADGRYVAFESGASNLVAGDSNQRRDIFVHDRQTGATTRVSVSSAGDQANEDCARPSISGDGRFVAFESRASNLVAGDTNFVSDIFVHDRVTGETTRVSVRTGGGEVEKYSRFPVISASGQHIAFQSASFDIAPDTVNGFLDIHLHDRATQVTERISSESLGIESNGWCGTPAINQDGRYVAFFSYGNNLVPADLNDVPDVFRRDRGPQNDTIVLNAPATLKLPGSLSLSFAQAPRVETFFVLYSFKSTGSSFFGHRIDLGDPVTEAARGQTSATGTGNFTSSTLPPSLAGRTVYTEIVVRDLSGRFFDSNLGVTQLQ